MRDTDFSGITMADVDAAAARIAGRADATPLVPSLWPGADLWLKLEICQPIGAFKLRGALNAVAGSEAEAFVCCSTGNHGRGVAWAARAAGRRAVICMSSLVPQAKVDGIRALGAEVRIVGRSQDDAQEEVLRLVREDGFAEVSPFDDPLVIAGQATIGAEIMAAKPDTRAILVPLSGGGLAAGVAFAAKQADPRVRVIGISMDRGAAMHASLAAGRPVAVEEVASLADSLGGGIGLENRLSFPMCRDLLDDVVLVTEAEIYVAMQALFHTDRLAAEGASAVGLAALMAGKVRAEGPVATILTGRNMDMDVFARIVTGKDVTLGHLTVKGQTHAA